jgi:hypothetical protein
MDVKMVLQITYSNQNFIANCFGMIGNEEMFYFNLKSGIKMATSSMCHSNDTKETKQAQSSSKMCQGIKS